MPAQLSSCELYDVDMLTSGTLFVIVRLPFKLGAHTWSKRSKPSTGTE